MNGAYPCDERASLQDNQYMTLALDRSNGVIVALMTDGDTNAALNDLPDGWSIA